jgi:aromatic-L-amino-acid/L-tryptophan decarboxylase
MTMTTTHSKPAAAFGMDAEEFRRLGHAAVEMAADYFARLPDNKVFTPMPEGERNWLLKQTLPEQGVGGDDIFRQFREQILPYPMGNGHPRFFGWVNSPPAMLGVIFEFLAASMDPSCAGGDHAAIYLEHCVTRWLAELLNFSETECGGLLVSGTSLASIIAIAAARFRALDNLGWNVRAKGLAAVPAKLVLYASAEAHSCIQKAVELLGLGADSMRKIAVEADFRMDVAALRKAILADRSAGREPFCVVASAGTAGTGAIDPLGEVAAICKEFGLWFHVDGAYGALGFLDPGLRHKFSGMEGADSLAVDPHKWLSVPVECGCILVRDDALLRRTFSLVPAYVQTEEGKGFGGPPWFSEYGPQQTRGFRALKLWATLLHAGREGATALVGQHHRLAQYLGEKIAASPDLELCAPITLSIVCFRYKPKDWRRSDGELNALNKKVMQELQAQGEVFVTNAMLHGSFALRANVMNYMTTEQDIDVLVEQVSVTAKRLYEGLSR